MERDLQEVASMLSMTLSLFVGITFTGKEFLNSCFWLYPPSSPIVFPTGVLLPRELQPTDSRSYDISGKGTHEYYSTCTALVCHMPLRGSIIKRSGADQEAASMKSTEVIIPAHFLGGQFLRQLCFICFAPFHPIGSCIHIA